MPITIADMDQRGADKVFELLDLGRGHTVERHGDVDTMTLIARGTRLSVVTSWVRADEAFAALKELLHRDWQVQSLLKTMTCRRLVVNSGEDFDKAVKVRQVTSERGKVGYEGLEGEAKVSVTFVVDAAGAPPRGDDTQVTVITMYPSVREWVGKPKPFC